MKKSFSSAFESPMETPLPLTECRRDLYGLLSSAYIHIPQRNTLETGWEPAVRLLRFPQEEAGKAFQEIENGLTFIRDYLSKRGLAPEESLIDLQKDWTYLFRGVKQKGPLPPYESLYRIGRLQGKPAQEMNRLFSKMGINVPEEWHQPPDYIGVELDFMRLLCEKEREAREKTEREALREALENEKSFLQEHLALWVPVFCEKMMEQAREGFYRGIALITKGLVHSDRIYVTAIVLGPA